MLPKRLERYGLKLHEEKSQIIPSGHYIAERAHRKGESLPTYKFLGFLCYWGKERKGFWRLKYRSRLDRFSAKLKGLRKFLRNNLNKKDTDELIRKVIRVLQGWINYHAISGNQRRVTAFIHESKKILFRWFNRRGGKRMLNWGKFMKRIKRLNYLETFKVVSMFKR